MNRILKTGAFTLAFAISSFAMQISFTFPAGGETLYVGDTVMVTYAADEDYKDGATGTYIEISTDQSKGFAILHPIHIMDLGIDKILLSDSSWGRTKIVIPDSVVLKLMAQKTKVSTVSDSVVFRIRDYSGINSYPYVVSQSFKIRPATEKKGKSDESDTGCGKGVFLSLLPVLLLQGMKKRYKRSKDCLDKNKKLL